jgi:hypothetical protein
VGYASGVTQCNTACITGGSRCMLELSKNSRFFAALPSLTDAQTKRPITGVSGFAIARRMCVHCLPEVDDLGSLDVMARQWHMLHSRPSAPGGPIYSIAIGKLSGQ